MINSICFLTTYRCNAKCDYCECGPKAENGLTLAEMVRLIDEAAELGTVNLVVFSGGEPSLLRDDLFAAIGHATSRGMLTRVVTNGMWGITPKKAEEFVDRLLEAGLSEINISVDDLHQRWIPLERPRNAFLACYKRGVKCLLAHKQNKSSMITVPYLREFFGVDLIDYEHGREYTEEEQCRLISSGSIIPVGRNEDQADLSDHIYGSWRHSCGSVLRDIIVGARGNFLPCCGIVTKNTPELTREDLRTTSLIDAIDNANRDVMLNWIALEGPAAIAEFVKEKDPSVQFADEYVGICHICNEVLTRPDVRRVIAEHLPEITERVSTHRAFFEGIRGDEELVASYLRP